jgi:hypothetical protein
VLIVPAVWEHVDNERGILDAVEEGGSEHTTVITVRCAIAQCPEGGAIPGVRAVGESIEELLDLCGRGEAVQETTFGR